MIVNQCAFPASAVYDHSREQVNSSSAYGADAGMALSDYFAAKAMAALIPTVNMRDLTANMPEYIANEAYKIAQEMLKAKGRYDEQMG